MVKAHLINSLLSQNPPRGLLKFSKSWHWELTCKGFHLCSDFHNSLLELLFLLQGLNEFFQRSLGIKAFLHLQGQHDTYREKGNNECRILTFSRRTSHSQQVRAHIFLWITSVNELCDLLEVVLHQASGGQSWWTKPQATGTQSTFISFRNTCLTTFKSENLITRFNKCTQKRSQCKLLEGRDQDEERLTRVKQLRHVTRAGVLITGNGTGFQNLLCSASIGSFASQVQQDQMVVRTP